MDSIQEAATECNGFKKVIPKNKDDENRIEAIEAELIKLGSETNMMENLFILVSLALALVFFSFCSY